MKFSIKQNMTAVFSSNYGVLATEGLQQAWQPSQSNRQRLNNDGSPFQVSLG